MTTDRGSWGRRFDLSAAGLAELKRQWDAAGRQIYKEAIRTGQNVLARTQQEIEALGRAHLEQQKLQQAQTRAVGQAVKSGATRVGDAARQAVGVAGRQVEAAVNAQDEVDKLRREQDRVVAKATPDAVGKLWSAGNTARGLGLGMVGHQIGEMIGTKPYVTTGANAIQFRNNPLGGVGAVTLGNVTIYDGDPADPSGDWASYNRKHGPVWEHERQHTIQAQQLGPLYLPSNVLGGGLALLRDRDEKGRPDWHGPSNWNERGPQEPTPRPWPSRSRR